MADWRKDTLVFETEKGKATYYFAGICLAPDCLKRTYALDPKKSDTSADDEIGDRIAGFVVGGVNEPPAVFCQAHYLSENETVARQIQAGMDALEADKNKDALQQILDQTTAALGGITG